MVWGAGEKWVPEPPPGAPGNAQGVRDRTRRDYPVSVAVQKPPEWGTARHGISKVGPRVPAVRSTVREFPAPDFHSRFQTKLSSSPPIHFSNSRPSNSISPTIRQSLPPNLTPTLVSTPTPLGKMDFSMEIDHQSNTRKRSRDDFATDDFAEVSFPTAKKTRQFHFPSTDAFASAFALAQSHPFQPSSASMSSSSSYNDASSPNESGQSSPGPEFEDPFHAAMAVDPTPVQEIPSQPQPQQYHQLAQQQPSLHTPPGRRGMIIAGWNQARRTENMAPIVQCWPQR
ncbi:hypothetical protein V8F20_011796 [Naviculisporaceae sp. PSN 640]